jgi:hypothetical protein
MARMSALLSREEIMMKQRSILDWHKEGDQNTSFFHSKARERAQVNRISALRKEDATIVTSQEGMETEAMEFYSRLFTRQELLYPRPILSCVPEKVTPLMNESLVKPFTEEVRTALFMMGASKALGPDGLSAGFYQYHWELLGADVTATVLDFLNGGELSDSINKTTIVLIPKIRQP